VLELAQSNNILLPPEQTGELLLATGSAGIGFMLTKVQEGCAEAHPFR
jgi:hypothetical protein